MSRISTNAKINASDDLVPNNKVRMQEIDYSNTTDEVFYDKVMVIFDHHQQLYPPSNN